MSDTRPEGPVTLWLDYGGSGGWKFYDFPTVQAALESKQRGWADVWHIARPVKYAVIEESAGAPISDWVPPPPPFVPPAPPENLDEEIPF